MTITRIQPADADVVALLMRAAMPADTIPVRELEELLVAVDDRLELVVDPDRRARLQRGRARLELELARALTA